MKRADAVPFQAAQLEDLVARARAAPDHYAGETLRSELLSVGVYLLPAGGTDDQTPHAEDEVYFVVLGRGRFRVGRRIIPCGRAPSSLCPPRPPISFTTSRRSSS